MFVLVRVTVRDVCLRTNDAVSDGLFFRYGER